MTRSSDIGILLLTLFGNAFAAAVHPGTSSHVTNTETTSPPRPTPERYEFVNNLYMYDRNSHFLCDSHYSRIMHYCMCYHVPYEHRADIHEPSTLLATEKRMYELFLAGNYVKKNMTELKFYSMRCYGMCTRTNYNPGDNTTLYMVYDDPLMSTQYLS
ncbi:uncharacterized protein LOC134264773 [Saccostrea cucullata]|uniref:uncharacterized protein LOC134264773 n=1 Tax=Saccostrea cuccullata TaxID=36930 RepID=UPI002ED5D830